MVRKQARFAVYEETIISVKNHQIAATILVEAPLGTSQRECEYLAKSG